MEVPFVDLGPLHRQLNAEIVAAMDKVIAAQSFILGETVAQFESEIAAYLGVRHAIGVSSGSDALLVSLLAQDIGPGDEVIVPAFGFVATPEAVRRTGASVRFVDVERRTCNLDASCLEAAIGPNTKAILVVHLYGYPVEMDSVQEIAARHEIPVIEDAAQAMGAEYHGKKVGGLGSVGCFSFFPSKPLGALGDGGLIATNDDALATRCRELRVHGKRGGNYAEVGGNFRLDALQAAVLRVKLKHFEQALLERRALARAYDSGLAGIGGLSLPPAQHGVSSAYGLYTVRVQLERTTMNPNPNSITSEVVARAALSEAAGLPTARTFLAQQLAARGVQTRVYYPRALVDEPVFLDAPGRDAPVARQAAVEVLSLPLFVGLAETQRDLVVETVSALMRDCESDSSM